jgi:EpsI family protein
MSRLQKATAIAIAVLAGAALVSKAIQEPSHKDWKNMLGRIPMQVGDWHGENDEYSEAVKEVLAGSELLLRHFRNSDGEFVSLSVINSPYTNTFHDPHACYHGVGFNPVMEYDLTIPFGKDDKKSINAHFIVMANKEGRQQYLLSWYSDDTGTWNSVRNFKLHMLWQRIRQRKYTPGFLIMISTAVDVENEEIPKDRLIRFAKALIPYVHPNF